MGSQLHAIGADHPLSRDIPGFVRELGLFERLIYAGRREHTGYLSNALLIVSKVPLTEGLVYRALQRLMKMIPTLRYVIRDHRPDGTPLDGPVLIESSHPSIELETLETTDWIAVIEKEWFEDFDTYHGPCWRVKFLPNVQLEEREDAFRYSATVVFTFSHVLIDGMSYQRCFGHFLDCLEAVTRGTKEEPKRFQPCPPLDHYLDVKPGMLDGVAKVIMTNILKSPKGRKFIGWLSGLGKKHNYLACNKLPIEQDPSTPKVSSLVPLVISREDTACIVRAAKARGATVHGVLTAAATFAYVKMIQGDTFPFNMTIPTFTPVSMRRLHKELTLDSYGMYLQVLMFKLSVNVESACDEYEAFWALAHSTTNTIKQKIEMKSYLEVYKMFGMVLPVIEKYHPPFDEMVPYKYGRDETEFYLTNMMKCDFLTRGDDANFKLVGRFGGMSSAEVGPVLGSNLNTFNDQIYWTLIYEKHIIHREKVVTCGSLIQKVLKSMCGDSAV